jgi:predicted nucleic acid-binding protein
MSKVVLLDTGPLGQVTHPRVQPEIMKWLQFLQKTATALRVPEIADYELRRELLRLGKQKSIERLDQFGQPRFIPLTPETMRKAAELWAWVRDKGQPTASKESLDGDVILAAQATLQTKSFNEVVIITTNLKHISRFQTEKISVCDWQQALENSQSDR